MTPCEPHEVFPCRQGVEGEVVGGDEVIGKTYQIAHCIGDVYVYPYLNQLVCQIVDGCCHYPVDAEPGKLLDSVFLLDVL